MSDEPVGALVRLRVDDLQLHSACDLVPEMTSQEWTEFLADIGRRGIQEPVVIDGPTILDGRHRFRAAQAAGIETLVCRRVVLGEDEQIQYVIAAALHRRQLSDDQRAIMAAKYRERLVKESKSQRGRDAINSRWSQPDSGEYSGDNASPEYKSNAPPKERATIRAARQFSTPERKVRSATTIIKNCDPKIIAAVEAGQISLACAKTLAQLSPHKQSIIASGGWGCMKTAARQAIEMGTAREIPEDNGAEADDEGDEAPAPRLSMVEEAKRLQARDREEKSDRTARVERMAFIQKLKSFDHDLEQFRDRTAPEDMEAEWPAEQLDEVYDLMDRIQQELAIWVEALKEVE